jgi:hypothetical protein
MTTEKYLGIWMDHSHAYLTEFTPGAAVTKTITSKFTHLQKEQSLKKSEHLAHQKEKHQHSEYYKEIGKTIRQYARVLLFGPTDAKVELYNSLKTDHLFDPIQIEVKQADKMTEKEQHAFIGSHFSAL